MTRTTISGRDVHTGAPLTLAIEQGRIQAIADDPPQGSSSDADVWIAPGLIDLQVNGYRGCDLNAADVDADVVHDLACHLLAVGVTTFLPTIITASEEQIVKGLRAIAHARKISPLVAHAIPSIHVEGPFLSPEDGPRGAHPLEHIRPANIEEFYRWQVACDGLIGMVTISPHTNGALECVAQLSNAGVHVAIGHTAATPQQIHHAAALGATLSTHLGNGIAANLPRHPNLLWAQLAEDRLSATFIADGHHLPEDTLRAMVRAKGIERSILVSDLVALGGMPAGIYQTPIGGSVQVTQDGRIVSASGGTFLAGAYCPLVDGVAHAAGLDTFSLGDAIRMATENPGRFAGGRGRFHVGADADLIQFRWPGPRAKLELQAVYVHGEQQEPSHRLQLESK